MGSVELPNLQDLLPGALPNTELIDSVRWWLDESDDPARKKLLSSKAVRDAVALRIQAACDACGAALSAPDDPECEQSLLQHLMAIDVLVSLVPQEPNDRLARLLLFGCDLLKSLASIIHTLHQLATQFDSPSPVAAEVLHTGRGVLAVVLDACDFRFTALTQPSQRPAASQLSNPGEATGREALGPALLEQLMALINMDERLSASFYSLRRSGASVLRELVTRCRRNQQLLLGDGLQAAYCHLMSTVLPSCGDLPTQTDLLEVLHRCAKAFGERAYHQHLSAQMRGLFAQLLARDASEINLEEELQQLVGAYNASLGPRASVVCVEAERLSVSSALSCIQVSATQLFVSSSHISLAVQVDDPIEEGVYDEEQLDIDHSNISRVIITAATAAQHAKAAGQFMIDLQCRAFPPSLGPDLAAAAEAATAGGGGARGRGVPLSLKGLLQEQQLDKLTRLLKAQDVLLVNARCGVMDPSQPESKPCKMSMGNMPASYNKAPLSLVKTTPSTSNRPSQRLQLFKTTPQTRTPASAAAAAAAADSAAATDHQDGATSKRGSHRTRLQLTSAQKDADGNPAAARVTEATTLAATTPPGSPTRPAAAAAAAAADDNDNEAAAAEYDAARQEANPASPHSPAGVAAAPEKAAMAGDVTPAAQVGGATVTAGGGDTTSGGGGGGGGGSGGTAPRSDSQVLALLDNIMSDVAEARLPSSHRGSWPSRHSMDDGMMNTQQVAHVGAAAGVTAAAALPAAARAAQAGAVAVAAASVAVAEVAAAAAGGGGGEKKQTAAAKALKGRTTAGAAAAAAGSQQQGSKQQRAADGGAGEAAVGGDDLVCQENAEKKAPPAPAAGPAAKGNNANKQHQKKKKKKKKKQQQQQQSKTAADAIDGSLMASDEDLEPGEEQQDQQLDQQQDAKQAAAQPAVKASAKSTKTLAKADRGRRAAADKPPTGFRIRGEGQQDARAGAAAPAAKTTRVRKPVAATAAAEPGVTQDPIEDPSLPLPPADAPPAPPPPAPAAPADTATTLPSWITSPAAAAPGGAAVGPQTTPISHHRTATSGPAAPAAGAAAGQATPPGGRPASAARRSRLYGMQATTPNTSGRLAAGAGAPTAAAAAHAAADSTGNAVALKTFRGAKENQARNAMSDAFPSEQEQSEREAADEAEGTAESPAEAAAAAAAAAAVTNKPAKVAAAAAAADAARATADRSNLDLLLGNSEGLDVVCGQPVPESEGLDAPAAAAAAAAAAAKKAALQGGDKRPGAARKKIAAEDKSGKLAGSVASRAQLRKAATSAEASAAAAAKVTAAGKQQQQQPSGTGSDFDFDGDESAGDDDKAAAAPAKGRKVPKAAAARGKATADCAKAAAGAAGKGAGSKVAGAKRKAADAADSQQQRRAAAQQAEAAAIAEQEEAAAAAAATEQGDALAEGLDAADFDMGCSPVAATEQPVAKHQRMTKLQQEPAAAAPKAAATTKAAAAGHKLPQQKKPAVPQKSAAADKPAARASRKSKTKAMQAMQEQLQDTEHQQPSPAVPAAVPAPAPGRGLLLKVPAVPGDKQGGSTAAALQLGGVGSKQGAAAGLDTAEHDELAAADDDDDDDVCGDGLGGVRPDDTGGLAGEAGDAASPSSDAGLDDLAHLAAAAAAGARRGPLPAAAAGEYEHKGLDLDAGGCTPDTLKIHTAKVIRRLPLTGAAATSTAAVPPAKTMKHTLLPLPLGATAAPATDSRPADCPRDLLNGRDTSRAAAAGAGTSAAAAGKPRTAGAFTLPALGAGKSAAVGLAGSKPAAAAAGHGRGRAETAGGSRRAAAGRGAGQGWPVFASDGDDAPGIVPDAEEGSQTDITMLAQLLAQQLRGADGDDDGEHDADSDEEVELLQAALVAALTKKRATARHKQEAIIKEVEAAVLSKVGELEASLHQDMAALAAAGQARLAAVTTALQDKADSIAAMKAAFDEQLAMAWQQYGEMYGQLGTLQEELQLRVNKKRASHKRKLDVLQQEAGAMISEAQQQLVRRRGSGDGRRLAGLLQAIRAT